MNAKQDEIWHADLKRRAAELADRLLAMPDPTPEEQQFSDEAWDGFKRAMQRAVRLGLTEGG